MAENLDPEIVQAARTHAPDAYIAATLAPRPDQAHLIALAAFLGDVERIVATVSDPALAEIRLQWWRDTIAGAGSGQRTGHPGADALGEAVRAHGLPFATFDALLDARALDLYADPLPGEPALDAYLDKTDVAALRLAALCLGAPASQVETSPLIAAAGQACGITRLLARAAQFHARGRSPFPAAVDAGPAGRDRWRGEARRNLAQSRILWRTATRIERTACLPLAVVEPYLKATEKPGHEPLRTLATITPLMRMWHMWQGHALGRF